MQIQIRSLKGNFNYLYVLRNTIDNNVNVDNSQTNIGDYYFDKEDMIKIEKILKQDKSITHEKRQIVK
jgi:hypothetical protein